jgi:hypothetical protein
MEDDMNAAIYLSVNARLAYYDSMKRTAPVRLEAAHPAVKPRRGKQWFQKQRSVILLPTETQHV